MQFRGALYSPATDWSRLRLWRYGVRGGVRAAAGERRGHLNGGRCASGQHSLCVHDDNAAGGQDCVIK